MFGMTSYKTTIGGVLAMLGGVVTIGNMAIGNAPLDTTQVSLAMAAIGAGWTGLMAKDHNVSNAPSPLATPKVVP